MISKQAIKITTMIVSLIFLFSLTACSEKEEAIDVEAALPKYIAICESYNLKDIEITVRDGRFLTIYSSNFWELSDIEMLALYDELLKIASEEKLVASMFKSDGYSYIISPPEISKVRDLSDIENWPSEGEVSDPGALQIQEGWNWEIDGNYNYVRGRVENIGADPINYFEVTAEYLDEDGNVLDSDYTNSGQTLNPGDMKEFEIMHRHSSEYKKVRIYVNEYM
jgi:hypothetical protein